MPRRRSRPLRSCAAPRRGPRRSGGGAAGLKTSGFGALLLEVALEHAHVRRQLALRGFGQEGVEPAAMLDRAKRVRRHPQAHRALQRVGLERHVHEVRQELALGLAVRVAHEVAREHGLAGEFATARHGSDPCMRSRPLLCWANGASRPFTAAGREVLWKRQGYRVKAASASRFGKPRSSAFSGPGVTIYPDLNRRTGCPNRKAENAARVELRVAKSADACAAGDGGGVSMA